LLGFIPNPEVNTRYAVLNPTRPQIVFLCGDGGIRIHDLMRPATPPDLHRHPQGQAILSGAFSRDGQRFLTGHQNGDVLVWEASTWKPVTSVTLSIGHPVRELTVSANGQAFAAEGEKELELWSLAGDKPTKLAGIGPTYNFGEGLAISPKGDLVATGGMFDILVHDLKTGKELRKMRHASYTMGLEFSPDGTRIASAPRGNVNKFLAVFDAGTGNILFNKGPFANYVAGMAFSPDGKRIAATGCENLVRLFDATTGEIVWSLPRPNCGNKPGFSRGGRLLGWSEPDGFHFIDLGPKPKGNPT
jgi:WD40 repeat protein